MVSLGPAEITGVSFTSDQQLLERLSPFSALPSASIMRTSPLASLGWFLRAASARNVGACWEADGEGAVEGDREGAGKGGGKGEGKGGGKGDGKVDGEAGPNSCRFAVTPRDDDGGRVMSRGASIELSSSGLEAGSLKSAATLDGLNVGMVVTRWNRGDCIRVDPSYPLLSEVVL